MNIKLDFSSGTFICSKDQLGYQEVLDDFKNAKIIRVVTFNISKSSKDDKLFNLLLNLEDSVDVEIITNIPSKLKWYATSKTGEYLKRTASTTIDIYLNKLNPQNFNASITPFFNFNNHSKIIGTENMVYIGSANFSNESANNYETGVIVKDKIFIKQLYEYFFNNLKKRSTPYFDDDFNKLRLFILSILTRLINHRNYIIDTMFIFNDELNKYVFIDTESSFSQDDLFELIHDLYELKEIESLIYNINCDNHDLGEAIDDIYYIYNSLNIDWLLNLIEIGSAFYDYVSFSSINTFNDCFQKYSLEAYDEYLDYYVDKATDESREIFYDICQNADEFMDDILINLEEIIKLLERINLIICDNSDKAISYGIDNTK